MSERVSLSSSVMRVSLTDQLADAPRKNLSIRTLPGETSGKKLSEQDQNRAFARVFERAAELSGWSDDRLAQEFGYANSSPISKWKSGADPVQMGRVWACRPFRTWMLLAQAHDARQDGRRRHRPRDRGDPDGAPRVSAHDHAVVGEAIPQVCLIEDVCRHLRLSRRTFQRLMSAHELPLVELMPLGRVRRFQGKSVEAIQNGRHAVALRRAR